MAPSLWAAQRLVVGHVLGSRCRRLYFGVSRHDARLSRAMTSAANVGHDVVRETITSVRTPMIAARPMSGTHSPTVSLFWSAPTRLGTQ